MLIDPLTGNAAFSGQMVKVKALTERREIVTITAKPVTILYGSRTGNAEALASDVARKVESYDMAAHIYAMEDIDLQQLSGMERVLILCSTYGEGDMPDNAQALWDEAKDAEKGSLSGLNYSVLALGDTAYETYCQAGKNWDSQLEKLGAARVSLRIDCDVDYTENFENWMADALPLMAKAGDQDKRITQASRANIRSVKGTSRDNPLEFTLTEKRALTGQNSSKETYHYTLSHPDIGALYKAGGILNIFPTNDPALVELFAKTVGIKPSSKKHAELAQLSLIHI